MSAGFVLCLGRIFGFPPHFRDFAVEHFQRAVFVQKERTDLSHSPQGIEYSRFFRAFLFVNENAVSSVEFNPLFFSNRMHDFDFSAAFKDVFSFFG